MMKVNLRKAMLLLLCLLTDLLGIEAQNWGDREKTLMG